jgi:hypothetical protein
VYPNFLSHPEKTDGKECVTFDNYTLERAAALWCDFRRQFTLAGEHVAAEPAETSVETE